MAYINLLRELLSIAVMEQASEIDISAGSLPLLKINGKQVSLKGKVITPLDSENLAKALMTEEQYSRFLEEKQIGFPYSFGDKAEFIADIFYQNSQVAFTLKAVPRKYK